MTVKSVKYAVESVYHMIVEYEGYERERQVTAKIGRGTFYDRYADKRKVMCALLGISDEPNGQLIKKL